MIHSKHIEKSIELVSVAIQVLDLLSNDVDDEDCRRWSDEDGWDIKVDSESIEVTITRCERGYIHRWYVPHVESVAGFNRELSDFVAEAFS